MMTVEIEESRTNFKMNFRMATWLIRKIRFEDLSQRLWSIDQIARECIVLYEKSRSFSNQRDFPCVQIVAGARTSLYSQHCIMS